MATLFGDRWEIRAALGEGGQAHTFTVVDRRGSPDELYVLKRLKNVRRLERFRREIEAMQSLNHENIVRLVDFDVEGIVRISFRSTAQAVLSIRPRRFGRMIRNGLSVCSMRFARV